MRNLAVQICVLGTGHLAAAVRARLRVIRAACLDMNEGGCGHDNDTPMLFLACSDFGNTSLRPALVSRARRDGASVVFACITGEVLHVGPYITPSYVQTLFASYRLHRWDLSRDGSFHAHPPRGVILTPKEDNPKSRLAQIGAMRLIRELANLRVDDRIIGEDEGLLEFESPSYESGIDEPPEREASPHASVTGSHLWNRITHVWHPAQL